MDQNKVNESNESIETVDLTIKDPLNCLSEADSLELPDLSEVIAIAVKSEIGNGKESESKTICYDRFEKPHRKLDRALVIPYDLDNIKNFRNIKEEILSRTLTEKWGKLN
ncbi:hypothetical protein C2G38_2049167 [Gigaspora rosea]|uniref:Uncharacterized protein n=1 Tax=Gigaspora rosea TaxID=44941 RepID=A0A397TZY5_9GLOM|nr:hypothetical protein C2G38_2049167 [Gigaspora rosea]